MNIFFRADANSTIGMGHVMRCLSIADAVSSLGHKVKFVLADSTVDILINYNAYAKADSYEALYQEASDTPDLILGPTYAPLRSMFRELPRKIQSRTVQNILISTGGSDELHVALALLKALSRGEGQQSGSSSTNPDYHFLIGAMNEDKHEIQTLAESPGLSGRVMIHHNVTDMKGFISSADLAVSAAGSTLYEISACGVPLITYSLADNQLPGAKSFSNLGMALDVGDLRDPATIDSTKVMSGELDEGAADRILSAIRELTENYERRVEIGNRMQDLIDGFGADRMVEELLKY